MANPVPFETVRNQLLAETIHFSAKPKGNYHTFRFGSENEEFKIGRDACTPAFLALCTEGSIGYAALEKLFRDDGTRNTCEPIMTRVTYAYGRKHLNNQNDYVYFSKHCKDKALE